MKKKIKAIKGNQSSKKVASEETQAEQKITPEQINNLLNENYYLNELSKMRDESQYRLQLVTILQKMMMLLEKLPTLIEVMQKTPKVLEEIKEVLDESSSEEEKEVNDNPLTSEEEDEESP